MIYCGKKLDHRQYKVAKQIYSVWRRSYRIEADLLDIEDFPPLRRSVNQIMAAESDFYGYWQEERLTAVSEIEHLEAQHIHIAALVVDPDFFRRGLASRLLTEVLDLLDWRKVTVDTAVANAPAINLYKKLGFTPLKQWQTPDNIPMITLYREQVL